MATITGSATGGNWNATTAWVGGVIPGASDDVLLTATTGPITVNVNSACRSLNCTGYTNTYTHAAGVTLSIGDATAGLTNVALKFVAGMTLTLGSTSTSLINFVSTSATQQSITSGGKTMPSITFNGVAGSWQLADALPQGNLQTITFTNGTFDSNNQAITFGEVRLGAGTKTVTFGSSAITAAGTTFDFNTNVTGLTFNCGTSNITFNPTASATPVLNTGGKTFYNVSAIKSTGGFSVQNGGTFNNLTQDNTVVGSGNRAMSLQAGVTYTINGVFTYIGFNNSNARGRLLGGAPGTATTIALGTTGTAVLTNVDIIDMAFTGTNAPVSALTCSNLGGNSGITFASPVTYYWVGGTGSLSQNTHWSTSSGGSAGSLVPLAHDIAIFDSNSLSVDGQTITNDMFRFCGIDLSGLTFNHTIIWLNPAGAGNTMFGSVVYHATKTTTSTTGAAGGLAGVTLSGRGSYVLDTKGNTPPSTFTTWVFDAVGGTYDVLSDVNLGASRTFQHSRGRLNLNSANINVGLFNSGGTSTRTLDRGSSVITVSGTGNVINFTSMSNLTYIKGTSKFIISDTSATTKSVVHGSNLDLGDLTITGGSANSVSFGANTLTINNYILSNPGGTYTFQSGSGSTTTFTGTIAISGASGNLTSIISGTPGSPFFWTKTSGIVSAEYLSLKDSTAQGGATWYAGRSSTNVSGNTGWLFTSYFIVTYLESFSIVESVIKSFGRLLNLDVLSITENFIRLQYKTITEIFSITEIRSNTEIKTVSESLTITESFKRLPLKNLIDIISVVENFTKLIKHSFSDVLTFVDSLLKGKVPQLQSYILKAYTPISVILKDTLKKVIIKLK